MRRTLAAILVVFSAPMVLGQAPRSNGAAEGTARGFRVTLLGTGVPGPSIDRFGHIALLGNSAEDLLRRTRTTYAGVLEVGDDLMQIDVGDSPTVRRR